MRKIPLMLIALVVVATACAGGSRERSVFVDFSHDEFASFMIANFPKEVSVTQGDTVVFKQIWTGEPHTVTGGTLVNELMEKAKHFIPLFASFEGMAAEGVDLPNPEGGEPEGDWADVLATIEGSKAEPHRARFLKAYDGLVEGGSKLPPRDDPGDVSAADAFGIIEEESNEIFEGTGLPWALDEDKDGNSFVAQNAGQPCYLETGAPPEKMSTPCDDADQEQPEFDGKASYYNSGVIPYEGPQGNTYKVDLADDIDPGSYFFYCAVHGPSQYTEVKVAGQGAEVPSQEDVSRQARKEIETFAEPMLKAYRDAEDGTVEIRGEEVDGPFAGVTSAAHGSINEFVPKQIEAKVGEEVTWKLMGSDHTVTFDVPEYFPVIQFADDGTVSLNPKLQPPAGGSPPLPEGEEEGVTSIDGGTYDGEGFFSSGLFGGEPYAEYSLQFSRPGTYKYACLLHPPMVGTVEVT